MEKKTAKRLNTKILVTILTLALLLGGVVGGTVAWLIATDAPVVNTFTYGDINIELEETDTELDGDGDVTTNEYEMIPGNEITKDPVITVKADSEACYLFAKLVKSENFDTFLTYEVADGWTEIDDGDNDANTVVYYREVAAVEADTEFHVIKDDTVTVKEEVTKAQLNALDADGASDYPTLTVTGYAVQKDNVADAATAWTLVTGENTNP